MKTPIDLGRKSETGPMPVSMPESPGKECCHYPCLYIDGGPELADLPASGVMEIAFKRNSCTVTDRDGKKTTSVSVDVLKILDLEADASLGEKAEDTDDVLDKLAAESEDYE